MRALEQLLADWLGEAQVLRKNGFRREADDIERRVDEIKLASQEYLEWLSEEDAVLRSGYSEHWLRTRFAGWEHDGHAKKGASGERWYREIIVPQRFRDRTAA